MSGHLEYTKKFIILKNDFCNIPGKKPKGHVKIEIRGLKGSLSLSVENAEANQNYDVVLIAGNKTYSPGKIYTEKTARGREDIAFNISDLEANGVRISSLSGLVLAREENVLLGGYMGREDESIERYIKNLEDNLSTHQPYDEPLDFKEEVEIILSEDRLVGETDQDIIDDIEEKVEFVVSKELEEKVELVNKVEDEIIEETPDDKEISQDEKVESVVSEELNDSEDLLEDEEIPDSIEDEILDEEAIEGPEIKLDDSSDYNEYILEEVQDNIDLESEADLDEKSNIKVEFIDPEEFPNYEDLESNEEFFEPLEDFKEPIARPEFIENDVQMDDEDFKTYFKSSLDLDRAADDEESYPCDENTCKEYEDLAAINLDRVIDEPKEPEGSAPSGYDDLEFSEDDILFEKDQPFERERTIPGVSEGCDCTKIDIDVDKLAEEGLSLEEEDISLDQELIEEEIIAIDEVALEDEEVLAFDEPKEEIENIPIEEEIINDVKLEENLEDSFNLEDYDKKIIDQYESVFENKPVESNEEVIKISHDDYENNRRMIQKNQTTDYILNILKYFPEEDPLRQHLKGYKWWRIDFQDEAKGFLPYFNYVTGGKQKVRTSSNVNYISARELMAMYNHYLFGMYYKNKEVQYYIYAIPGGFYKDEHPHGGTSGFNTWFEGNEMLGYWLIYIDALTGEVIYPQNPMMPMD